MANMFTTKGACIGAFLALLLFMPQAAHSQDNAPCFAAEVIAYVQGTEADGGPIQVDRTDSSRALGEPDRVNAPGGFVSLGYGGSITLAFSGVVTDALGPDILVWETSFGQDDCVGSVEQASIELSADGISWTAAGSICRDGAVDLSDFSLSSASYIRISNEDVSTTFDGYDVDGVEAINGCGPQVSEECENYKLYYTHAPLLSSMSLMEVTLNGDGTASYITLLEDRGATHIGLSPDGSTIYLVGAYKFELYDVLTATISDPVIIQTAEGDTLQGIPAAVVADDGTLYVASGNHVYSVSATGLATEYGIEIPVTGGDLIFVDGDLWLITRINDTFTNVLTGATFVAPVGNINGAAVLPNGNVLVADGNGQSLFKELDLTSNTVVATYDVGLSLRDGDFAGRCITGDPIINPGQCYATELFEYVEGVQLDSSPLPLDRTDANQALGEPERTSSNVFVTLGYGGSLGVKFDGDVPNEAGDDIEVVETTFGSLSCAGYPEYADVYVSQNGADYFLAGTVCKSSPFVEIDNTGEELAYVRFVRIVNNDTLSTTPDGFEVDGVVAIHNCEEAPQVVAEASAQLSSAPNPTEGPSVVTFMSTTSGRTVLEVFDMSGRNVSTLFNQDVTAGQTYRVGFDASSLPTGIYMYRLTTNGTVTVSKFIKGL